MILQVIGIVSAFVAVYIALGYLPDPPRPTRRRPDPASKDAHLPSLIIPSMTMHKRYLPIPSAHAFSYPLVYLGLDLDALESHDLDSIVFKYHVHPLRAFTTISPKSYLSHPKRRTYTGLREELLELVGQHGVDASSIGKVWLVTMPTYLGFTGINPLTVWYLYDTGESSLNDKKDSEQSSDEEWVKSAFEGTPGESPKTVQVAATDPFPAKSGGSAGPRLKCVVLEVHNTFGERHAYVLQVGDNEVPRDEIASGIDHAWVFPRTFHVSPFNSRAGYYRLDIADPFHLDATKPKVRVTLSLLTRQKKRKLYAVLANNPSPSRPAVDITPGNMFESIVCRQPFDLLLTTPRILRQAWTLHFEKKLGVYPRPEPCMRDDEAAEIKLQRPWNDVEDDDTATGQSIGWIAPGWTERTARKLVQQYLAERTKATGKTVKILFENPEVETMRVRETEARPDLVIRTRHPSFFTQLLLAPTPEHVILSAEVDRHTAISSVEAFKELFVGPRRSPEGTSWAVALGNAVRRKYLFFLAQYALRPLPPLLVCHFPQHFTAFAAYSPLQYALLNLVMALTYYGDKLEEWIMYRMNAKFVQGHAPWEIMLRIADRVWDEPTGSDQEERMDEEIGSVFMR